MDTASEEELRSLKGIGDVRAAAIVMNRPYNYTIMFSCRALTLVW